MSLYTIPTLGTINKHIYPGGVLLEYNKETERWVERVPVEELVEMITFLWNNGFKVEYNYRKEKSVTLWTGNGMKEVPVTDLEEKNLAKSYRYVWSISMEKIGGELQGRIFICENYMAFCTRIDTSVVSSLVKQGGLEMVKNYTFHLKNKLSKLTSDLELKWVGEVATPTIYKVAKCSFDNLKGFVNSLEKISKELPLFWE